MSLNENYIINGSTLSDIGNALRTSGIIPATKEVTKLVWYKIDSGSASGNGSSTSTINQNFFQAGNAVWDGTIAKVNIVITSGNPKINGAQYYSGNTVTVNIPCTISISGSIMYPSNTYSYGCKIYPLTSDGQNIDCIQTSSYGGVYSENSTVNVPNTIAVEDIADAISAAGGDLNVALISSFKIGGYNDYPSYSTDLSSYGITKIEDIKYLIFVNTNASKLYFLHPDEATLNGTRTVNNVAVNQYKMDSYSNTTTSSQLSNIFMGNSRLGYSGYSTQAFSTNYFPAVLFY